VIFVLLISGLAVKAALFPLHGWLPVAMVAPAPVSALLHAVAVVKAGVFGIIRVIYDVFGPELAWQLGVLTPLAAVAAFTIIYGSLRAVVQSDIKAMLAYSTISQLSYIVLGAATLGITVTTGALMHLVHHGFMKITLFFCAGGIEKNFGIRNISRMDGIGYRSPLMMGAFTLAAFGLIGIPPMSGFPGKWYLSVGGLESGSGWIIAIMLTSSILNCIYFLPVIYRAWFKSPGQLPDRKRTGNILETEARLLVPALITVLMALIFGLFATTEYSPMALAGQIALKLYP
jgi:formate hydrogenlyase subunit 3/multisubunit Na+/H+ antiporter MnhD subunit